MDGEIHSEVEAQELPIPKSHSPRGNTLGRVNPEKDLSFEILLVDHEAGPKGQLPKSCLVLGWDDLGTEHGQVAYTNWQPRLCANLRLYPRWSILDSRTRSGSVEIIGKPSLPPWDGTPRTGPAKHQTSIGPEMFL